MACGCATLKPAQFPSGPVRCVTGGSAARWRRTVGHSVYSKSSPSLPHGRIRHVRTKLANKEKKRENPNPPAGNRRVFNLVPYRLLKAIS